METASAMPARRFSFDRLGVWTLVGTIVLAGIVIIPSSTIPFLATKLFVLALGAIITLACYILGRLTRGNVIVPPLGLLGALLLVPLAYGLSTLFSGANLDTTVWNGGLLTDSLSFIVVAAVLGLLAGLLIRRRAEFTLVFLGLGGLLACVIVLQVLFLILSSNIIPALTVSATIALPGSFADFGMILGLGLLMAMVALRSLTLSPTIRLILLILGVVSLLFLALVSSQTVWLLVGLGALGLFVEAVMRRRSGGAEGELEGAMPAFTETEMPFSGESTNVRPEAIGVPLVVLALSLFFLIGGSTLGNAITAFFGTGTLEVRPSWQSTLDIGRSAYGNGDLLFGSGPGTFALQWVKYHDPSVNQTLFWNTDFSAGIGFVPTSFVTTGIAGVVAWVLFFGLFLFFGVRLLLRRQDADPFLRFVSLASFLGMFYVFALAVISVPGPVVLTLGFLFAGLFASSTRFGESRREKGILFARAPRVGFAIVFVLTLVLLGSVVAAYSVVEHYLGNVALAEGSAAFASGDLDKASAAAASSISFTPTDDAYRLQGAIARNRMSQILSRTDVPQEQAQQDFQSALSSAVDAALIATRLAPSDYRNWVVLGDVYQSVVSLGIQGSYENAKLAYDRAASLNPTSPAIELIFAQLEIARRDISSARSHLEKAIILKPNYTQAIFLLSQLEVQAGNAREALIAAESALLFEPNNPVILFQIGILRSANGDVNGAIRALEQAVFLNPQYANAGFFLAVAHAQKGDLPKALAELQRVAALSQDNEKALAADLATLEAGKNPFPASRFGALGVPQAPVAGE